LCPTTARGKFPRQHARCSICAFRLREMPPGGGTAPTTPPAARGARPRWPSGWSSGREARKAHGHGHVRRAEGKDQDGEVDVTRRLLQPDGPGPCPAGPDPDLGRATHRPERSHPGRGGEDSVGCCRSTPTVESKNTSKTALRPSWRPGGREKILPVMTWNAEGILSNGRELALLSLLNDNDIDV
jgi:hypothetical protein